MRGTSSSTTSAGCQLPCAQQRHKWQQQSAKPPSLQQSQSTKTPRLLATAHLPTAGMAPSPDKTHGTPCAAGRCAPHAVMNKLRTAAVSATQRTAQCRQACSTHTSSAVLTHVTHLTAANATQTRTGHTCSPQPPLLPRSHPTTQHTYTTQQPCCRSQIALPPSTTPDAPRHTPTSKPHALLTASTGTVQCCCLPAVSNTHASASAQPRCLHHQAATPSGGTPAASTVAAAGCTRWAHQAALTRTLQGRHRDNHADALLAGRLGC